MTELTPEELQHEVNCAELTPRLPRSKIAIWLNEVNFSEIMLKYVSDKSVIKKHNCRISYYKTLIRKELEKLRT